ncbi:DUF4400 domain-containing protein [Rheinheimera sp.]|uniref:DUF4400 domain-containing protein n=1 Tax=Rheinheimera sp. TaxID=1869214 RepID=UPI004047134C
MPTVITASSSRLNLIFVLYSAMFLLVFMLMIIRSPDGVRESIETELKQAMVMLGVEEQYLLETSTKDRFQRWIHDSGFYPGLYKALAPERQREGYEEWQSKGSFGFLSEGWIWRLLENFQLYAYQVTHRLTLMEFWMLTMLPMMIAVIMTGYYTWKIKQYQLIAASTTHVRLWLKALWIVLFLFSIYLITPNIFGLYTIYAPPILLVAVALAISLILSNFSKQA